MSFVRRILSTAVAPITDLAVLGMAATRCGLELKLNQGDAYRKSTHTLAKTGRDYGNIAVCASATVPGAWDLSFDEDYFTNTEIARLQSLYQEHRSAEAIKAQLKAENRPFTERFDGESIVIESEEVAQGF